MPTKEEIIQEIENSPVLHFTKGMVERYVRSVRFESSNKVTHLKKGDVFLGVGGSGKKRPFVIISVGSECSLTMALSTTEDCFNISKSTSRFWSEGFFSKGVYCHKNRYIFANFSGVYDNQKKLEAAIAANKKYLMERM